jgi:hypothetical protein
MFSILRVILQFVLTTSNPRSTCELVHRDASTAGTYYLYCAQTAPDGIELVTVGHFVSDAAVLSKAVPEEKGS